MLIDRFPEHWLDELESRARTLCPANRLYLLIDGVFVPGLHRRIDPGHKILLFERLPGANEEDLDVSPFVTSFEPGSRQLKSVLRHCSGWPMISVIESPEDLDTLAARLAAWCIVEADGQRFHFRFADTRRLPAVLRTLSRAQRTHLAGPAVAWSHMTRDARWQTIALDGCAGTIAVDPSLDRFQFSALLEDSRIDEMLALLAQRASTPFPAPSVAYAVVSEAMKLAMEARVPDHDLGAWCTWRWTRQNPIEETEMEALFDTWRAQLHGEETS